jgi:AraC-like DNA-binding protein
LLLKLDRQVFAEYLHQLPLPEQECIGDFRPLSIWRVDGDLLDIFMKMEEACVSDTLGSLLMPLLKKERAIRLLAGRCGMDIRKALHATTSAGKISCAIEWLKGNYVEPFNVQTLANKAFMSVSTFRQYFRHVTGLSPLQYQKSLRLIEARKLMLSGEVDATHASMSVGYESISQFNREYRRMFGQPPMRDIRSIKGSNLFSSLFLRLSNK